MGVISSKLLDVYVSSISTEEFVLLSPFCSACGHPTQDICRLFALSSFGLSAARSLATPSLYTTFGPDL